MKNSGNLTVEDTWGEGGVFKRESIHAEKDTAGDNGYLLAII